MEILLHLSTGHSWEEITFLCYTGTDVVAKSTNAGAQGPGQGHCKAFSYNWDRDGQQSPREGLALWQVYLFNFRETSPV